MAKAAANNPGSAGGWGQGSPISRGDLLLVRKAIREGWDVPEATRDQICLRLHELLARDYGDVEPRTWIAVCRVILAMVGNNQAAARSHEQLPWGS